MCAGGRVISAVGHDDGEMPDFSARYGKAHAKETPHDGAFAGFGDKKTPRPNRRGVLDV
jgi:hypothetical protein